MMFLTHPPTGDKFDKINPDSVPQETKPFKQVPPNANVKEENISDMKCSLTFPSDLTHKITTDTSIGVGCNI
jgi:hypothetical protein